MYYCFFFFNDTAPTEIYTLSLHDALPILGMWMDLLVEQAAEARAEGELSADEDPAQLAWELHAFGLGLNWDRQLKDRKSTRLNSSHANISYAVFCLKKKKTSLLHRFPHS